MPVADRSSVFPMSGLSVRERQTENADSVLSKFPRPPVTFGALGNRADLPSPLPFETDGSCFQLHFPAASKGCRSDFGESGSKSCRAFNPFFMPDGPLWGMDKNHAFDEVSLPLFSHPADLVKGGQEAGPVSLIQKGTVRLPSYIADHRARLRQRFMSGGAEAMPDYELLELVLFRAIPRQDVKPLARRLLDRFGDFNRVLSADPSRLSEVAGAGPAVIQELKIIEAAAARLARSRVMNQPLLSSWDSLVDYCHTVMAHAEVEHFRILYLDRKNVLIADEEQARGTVNHVPVYPREIVRRALELNSSALILVHNHPSGDPSPSEADIVMTRRIVEAAEVMDITVHDHLIIGKSRELSFRSQGLL